MPRIAVPLAATYMPLSQSLEVVIVSGRVALLVRGKETFRLAWSEWERLSRAAEIVAESRGGGVS